MLTKKEKKIWKKFMKRVADGEDLFEITQEYVFDLKRQGKIY